MLSIPDSPYEVMKCLINIRFLFSAGFNVLNLQIKLKHIVYKFFFLPHIMGLQVGAHSCVSVA